MEKRVWATSENIIPLIEAIWASSITAIIALMDVGHMIAI